MVAGFASESLAGFNRNSHPGNGNRRLIARRRKAQAGGGEKEGDDPNGQMIEQIWIRKTS